MRQNIAKEPLEQKVIEIEPTEPVAKIPAKPVKVLTVATVTRDKLIAIPIQQQEPEEVFAPEPILLEAPLVEELSKATTEIIAPQPITVELPAAIAEPTERVVELPKPNTSQPEASEESAVYEELIDLFLEPEPPEIVPISEATELEEAVPITIALESEEFTQLLPPDLSEQMAEQIEHLSEEQIETAQETLNELLDTARLLLEVRENGTEAEIEQIEELLQQQCEALFESLGMKNYDEVVTQFIQNLLARDLYEPKIEGEQASVELGTHEAKKSQLDIRGGMVSLDGQTALHNLIGRLIIGIKQKPLIAEGFAVN